MSPVQTTIDLTTGRNVTVTLPPVLAIDERRFRNPLQQMAAPSTTVSGVLYTLSYGRIQGQLLRTPAGDLAILPRASTDLSGYAQILQATLTTANGPSIDLTVGEWLKHPLLSTPHFRDVVLQRIRNSWKEGLQYIEDDPATGKKGLRRPQIGALHAIHSHWSVTEATATIVLPTGTGKTETMLASLVSSACTRVLILVPSDALRTQIADKFVTLGHLHDLGVVSGSVERPVVGTLLHIPKTAAEVDDVFNNAHVVVTTSAIVGRADLAIQARIADHCSHLFIDEAHHSEARTWSAFKNQFAGKRILQFTATPFRDDGKALDGDIIFKYPLRKALTEGYFRPITFSSVVEFNPAKADEAIADKAIAQLRADADKGHVLMARVDSVERARQVFPLYEQYAEFTPVQLHTGITSQRERAAIREQILSGQARIIVCVDMLGEGFDLPTLKIAAFHDIRKSLAVTLQLAGRFTRARPDLGSPTFIANTADVSVRDELRKLYARDPDWSELLGDLSDRVIGEQQSLQDFLHGFTAFADEIPLKSISVATSAVAFKTRCDDWMPHNFRDGIHNIDSYDQIIPTINEATKTLVVVTGQKVQVPWTDVATLPSWEWHIIVAYWSKSQQLLYINSSSNAGEYKKLATAIAGDDVELINGEDVFRLFAGVHRLRLQQAGLTELLGRNTRYTGRMGSNVEPGITGLQRGRARKAVLSGTGFENGEKVTLGASRKGRVWSMRRTTINGLLSWCSAVGKKLLDETINPDDVLKGTLSATRVAVRPNEFPIAVDWPEEIYRTPESSWTVSWNGHSWNLSQLSIELSDPSVDGELAVRISSEEDEVELLLNLIDDGEHPDYRFSVAGNISVTIQSGDRSGSTDIVGFFYENPPVIWFANGASLEGNQFVVLSHLSPPYDPAKIAIWDWSGVDIRVESQGEGKRPDSIQARVIGEAKKQGYLIVFDDDSKGELADVVAIKLNGSLANPVSIEVDLFHCKYSGAANPGHRIDDLYEVCGQAQKSVSWMTSGEKQSDIFTHLLRRESQRQSAGKPTRIEVGSTTILEELREVSRVRPIHLRIFIVQPGVSKSEITDPQLRLLSVTETYLHETYQLPFGAIISK